MRFAGYRRARLRWRLAWVVTGALGLVWAATVLLRSARDLGAGFGWRTTIMLAFFAFVAYRDHLDRRMARIAWQRHPRLRGRPAAHGDVSKIARSHRLQILLSAACGAMLLMLLIPTVVLGWRRGDPAGVVCALAAGVLLLWSSVVQLGDRGRVARWALRAPRQLTRAVFR
jgi:hypothetical protein